MTPTAALAIGGRSFFSERCLVVGGVAQAHDGSLGTAHAFIDAIARTGADAVKFQTHIAAAESTPGEPWRVRFSRQDATHYDCWRRMEFSETRPSICTASTEKGKTGMSPLAEIEAIVECVRARSISFCVMQCSSSYPCPPERVGLSVLELFREHYNAPVGISDHSRTKRGSRCRLTTFRSE